MYRFWMQKKSLMSAAQEDRELDSLRRDLGTALDTAKWQVCLEIMSVRSFSP